MYSVMAFVAMSTVRAGVNHVSVKPPQEVCASILLPWLLTKAQRPKSSV